MLMNFLKRALSQGIFACIFTGIFLFSVCSCGGTPHPLPPAPPPSQSEEIWIPLTAALIEQLEQLNRPIEKNQLYLFGRITLEHMESKPTLIQDDRGRRLINDHTVERITINDKTPGQMIEKPVRRVVGPPERRVPGVETACSVDFDEYFDSVNDFLRFSNRGDNEGFFYLHYEDGEVQFRGKKYKVNYAGNSTPYLLIQLTQKDEFFFKEDTLKGRLIR